MFSLHCKLSIVSMMREKRKVGNKRRNNQCLDKINIASSMKNEKKKKYAKLNKINSEIKL
eukprot:m.25333 g.25333  ORF g.25333 m.25333 type:complete len:60 (-) comp5754_c0_seq1:1419-1598(-)